MMIYLSIIYIVFIEKKSSRKGKNLCITITKRPVKPEFTRPILAIQPGPNIVDKTFN